MGKAALGIGTGPVRRDEAAGLRGQFDETQRGESAQQRDGEDADAPSGDLRDGTGHQPTHQTADGGSGDEVPAARAACAGSISSVR